VGKRVLFISPQPFFEWRGSSIRVKFNVLALTDLGYEVDLLTLPIGENVDPGRCRIIRTWNVFGSTRISIGPSLLKLWFDFLLLIHATWLVLRNRYSVLHGTEETGFLCYLLTFICRANCIYEKHSDPESYGGNIFKRTVLSIYKLAEKITIRNSTLVICTGPGLKEQAEMVTGATQIDVIPDVPSSIVEPCEQDIVDKRAELMDNEEQVLVTYVGSFAEYQGVEIIFDAIPAVAGTTHRAKFIIIGGSQAEIDHYSQQLARHGKGIQIEFLGKINPDELPAYLAASDILLAPRKSGINSPLKLLDYFKAGGAIVATDTVANQRLLDQSNAVLCEFNTAAFSEAIIKLVDDVETRKSLGERGYQLYLEKYNFSVFTDQLAKAYNFVTGIRAAAT
jgi:glycosyltransferase involved in cell wall biosynthesis